MLLCADFPKPCYVELLQLCISQELESYTEEAPAASIPLRHVHSEYGG